MDQKWDQITRNGSGFSEMGQKLNRNGQITRNESGLDQKWIRSGSKSN